MTPPRWCSHCSTTPTSTLRRHRSTSERPSTAMSRGSMSRTRARASAATSRASVRAGRGRRARRGDRARPVHRPQADGRAGRVPLGAFEDLWRHLVRARASHCANELTPGLRSIPLLPRCRRDRPGAHRRGPRPRGHRPPAGALARGWEVEICDGPTAAAVLDHARRFRAAVRAARHRARRRRRQRHRPHRPAARHRRRDRHAHRGDPTRRARRLPRGGRRRLDRQGRLPRPGRCCAHRRARRHAADRAALPARRCSTSCASSAPASAAPCPRSSG